MEQIFDALTDTKMPSAWTRLGAEAGFQDVPLHKRCILVLALTGYGKTTFTQSIPGCLTLTFQPDSAGSIVGSRAARVYIDSIEKYEKVRDQLKKEADSGKPTFRQVAIDTADEFFWILGDKVIERWNRRTQSPVYALGDVGRNGKGFGEAAVLLHDEVRDFNRMGYGVVLTGHLDEKTVDFGGEKRTVMRASMTPKAYQEVRKVISVLGKIALHVRTSELQEIQLPGGKTKTQQVNLPESQWIRERRLLLQAVEDGDELKARMPTMPPYLVLPKQNGWATLQEAWDKATTQAQEEDQALRSGATE
jgi:hypothetical protein